MKRLVIFLALICAVQPAPGAPLEWLTDAQAAQDQARREDKFVLLDFTGSDWCGWCMKLKREVFDQPEFATFANANLVMVEVDFPHQKEQSPAEKQANEALAQTYHIEGYPTIIVLNKDGQEVGKTGYMEGGPAHFAAELEKIPGMKHVDLASGAVEKRPAEAEPEPPRKPVVFVPIAPVAPNHYNQLALKGISGAKDRRFAMINDQTLMAGETAKVRVLDQRLEVFCKEIRDDSVLITVEGRPLELKLGAR